jgi:hypothetical protein
MSLYAQLDLDLLKVTLLAVHANVQQLVGEKLTGLPFLKQWLMGGNEGRSTVAG